MDYISESGTGKTLINTFRPRQSDRYFADNIVKYIFLNEIVKISIAISLKYISRGSN